MGRVAALRGLFAPREDPYAGADLANARRLGAALWVIGVVIGVVLLLSDPPTEAVGPAGWAVAGALVGLALVEVWRMKKTEVGFGELLLVTYVGIAVLTIVIWLSGGKGAPLAQLFLLAFVYAAAVHPPRRAALCLGFASLAFLAPLTYDDFSLSSFAASVTQLLLWWGLGLVTMTLMTAVRAQRLQGQEESRLARIDPLTGLGNRRAFQEALQREVARLARSARPVSLLLADLDNFKDVNDVHGHPAGDDCLRRMAEALRLTVRAQDACFRWGGDEFAVVLPETGRDGAAELAERLVATIAAAQLGPERGDLRVTCGTACLTAPDSPEVLIAAADRDLIRAKRAQAGRREALST